MSIPLGELLPEPTKGRSAKVRAFALSYIQDAIPQDVEDLAERFGLSVVHSRKVITDDGLNGARDRYQASLKEEHNKLPEELIVFTEETAALLRGERERQTEVLPHLQEAHTDIAQEVAKLGAKAPASMVGNLKTLRGEIEAALNLDALRAVEKEVLSRQAQKAEEKSDKEDTESTGVDMASLC